MRVSRLGCLSSGMSLESSVWSSSGRGDLEVVGSEDFEQESICRNTDYSTLFRCRITIILTADVLETWSTGVDLFHVYTTFPQYLQ